MGNVLIAVAVVAVVASILTGAYLYDRRFFRRQAEARRRSKEALDQWRSPRIRVASDSESSAEELTRLAVDATPIDDERRLAFLEILRAVAMNPSTPPDVKSGVIARIGAEEASIRSDAKLAAKLDGLKGGRGGVFGGASFPLD